MQQHAYLVFAAGLLAATLSAQVPETPSPEHVPTAAFDLATQAEQPAMGQFDGAWWGSAAGYVARFAADGLTFTANADVPGGASVRFEFESARRVGGEVWPATSVEPDGDTERGVVHYRRSGVLERYDLRRHDVEQSFVFDRLPKGRGDLVVRLRIETALPCTAEGRADMGLAYDARGLGQITVGRVVGIDANGQRAAGWIRVAPGLLELGLPQRFVDTAALPLTLDPPIGSTIQAATGNEAEPDVAYDLSNDMYLVVWRTVQAGSHLVKARRVQGDGTLVGSVVLLGPCDGFTHVRVANINDRDSFVVVFEDNDTLKAKRVLPNGAVSVNPITISSNVSNGIVGFDVGGDMTTSDNDAIVVWTDSNNDIRVAQIEDSPSRGFQVFGEKVIGTGFCFQPAIAESGGSDGRYLVVWARDLGSSDLVIRGAVIDRNLAVLDSLVQVTLSSSGDVRGPAVDGDGLQWVVSYYRQLDVLCRSVQFHPASPTGTFIGPEMVIEADPGDTERFPSVAWLGDSALVCYIERGFSGGNAFGKTVDPFTCTICEPQFTLEQSPEDSDSVRCASQRSGGADNDRALIVWDSKGASFGGPIRARRYVADDGIAIDLGGGCGAGGTNYATCARVGHGDFRFRLREGFNANAVFFLGTERIDAACGACRLVPDPSTSVMLLVQIDPTGRAEIPVSIPNDTAVRDITLFSQWLLFTGAGGCTALPSDFSNALEIVIQ